MKDELISREEAIRQIQKYGIGCFDPDDFIPEQAERFVISRIKELQPKTAKWIPVSEKLPEKNVEVLVTTEWDCVTIGEMFSSNDWFIYRGAKIIEDIDNIKAWMPLPKPYESQESEDTQPKQTDDSCFDFDFGIYNPW